MRFLVQAVFVFSCLLPTTVFSAEKDEEYYELMKVFVDTFEQVDRNYVKDVDRRELMEAAIRGMLSKLDQYSDYISPEDLARFNQSVEQQFGGVGIQVNFDPTVNRLRVMTPLPGAPAYKAGVRAGDIIEEIEGKPTKDFPKRQELNSAVKLLKGKPGTKVTIGVIHLGSKEIEQLEVVRAVIQVATVLGDKYGDGGTWDFMLDDKLKIGYVRLTHFSRRSADELKVALDKLVGDKMKGMILDLRYNPGGLLSQATAISDMFIETGKIVSTRGRNSRDRVWEAKKEGTYSGFPMIILVNRFSASASEIVSACLQDHKRAVIVGERTWGKGSVQNVIELEAGQSALKLTTASYHRPSGKNIHRFPKSKPEDEWGVMPNENFEKKFSLEEMRDYQEYRQQRDVLREGEVPESDFVDKQLQIALEYLSKETGQAPAEEGKKKEKPAEAKKPAEKASLDAELPSRASLKSPAKFRPVFPRKIRKVLALKYKAA